MSSQPPTEARLDDLMLTLVPGDDAQILSYRHADKRVNNSEVGKVRWSYDLHLDPALGFDPQRSQIEALIDDALASGFTDQMRAALEALKRLQSPYLNWAGKAERTSFDIDTVSPPIMLTRVRQQPLSGKARFDINATWRQSCRKLSRLQSGMNAHDGQNKTL